MLLAEAFLLDSDAFVRLEAVRQIGETGQQEQASRIAKLLDDEHPGVRRAAALALGHLFGTSWRVEDMNIVETARLWWCEYAAILHTR